MHARFIWPRQTSSKTNGRDLHNHLITVAHYVESSFKKNGIYLFCFSCHPRTGCKGSTKGRNCKRGARQCIYEHILFSITDNRPPLEMGKKELLEAPKCPLSIQDGRSSKMGPKQESTNQWAQNVLGDSIQSSVEIDHSYLFVRSSVRLTGFFNPTTKGRHTVFFRPVVKKETRSVHLPDDIKFRRF